MAWNPQPSLGGALWSGNQTLATTRQLLSTSAGLENEILINNNYVSSISISTGTLRAGFAHIDQVSTASIVGSGYLGSLLIGDPDIGNNIQIASKYQIRNTAVQPTGEFIIDAWKTTIGWSGGGISFNGSPWAPINPVGTFTSLTSGSYAGPVAYIDGLSSLTLSTGTVYANSISSMSISTGVINAGGISSLAISTGVINAGGLSSFTVSTGTLKAGVTSLNQLGVSGTTSLSNTLNMNNQNITTAATIGATTVNATSVNATNIAGTLTGNSSGTHTGQQNGNVNGNVTGDIYNTNLNVNGKYSITETADVGSALADYANYGTVNISGKGGLGGIVNITADVATPLNPAFTVSQMTLESKGNYGNFVLSPPDPYLGYVPRGGLVSIIARQGLTPTPPATVTSELFGNGEIDLTAYSYGVVPGLIKLTSGANAMYAGSISPLTGIFGNNYIYGQYGNTITAGLPGGGIPNVPGTNYLYGYSGTVIQNGLYVDSIYNKYGGSLNIDSRTNNLTINSGANIYITGNTYINDNLDMTNGNINNVASINMSNNGLLNMSNGGLTNVSTMSGPVGSNIMIKNDENFIFFPSPDTAEASGGTMTTSGGRTFHTFTTGGTFTLNVSVGAVEVMLIGGGGGGGSTDGGGGGAGNMIIVTSTLSPGSFTVTVGTGGVAGTNATNGGAGGQSRFSGTGINVRALGGGGGSTEAVAAGGAGGSGGGGSGLTESNGGAANPGSVTGMAVVSNSAYAGGTNPGPGNAGSAGCGGGGSFSAGGAVNAAAPSDGGDGGLATLYYGTYYGGGGGGAAAPTGAYGTPHKGKGGGTAPFTSGGNGSQGASSTQAGAGVANTGGGGGGGESDSAGFPGAAGGSGVVIVSYTSILPQFTIGTLNQMYLSSSLVTIGNDLTILGNTNIQTETVNTINVTNLNTSGGATFAGNVFMTGPSTIISRLFISDTNQIQTFVMAQGGSTNIGSYTVNSSQQNVTYNGQQFPVSDWNCSASLAGFSLPQPYAANQAYVVTVNSGGFWAIQSVLGVSTLPAGGVGVQWTIRLTMTPRGMAGPNQLSATAPSTISSTGFALNMPFTFMSSITGSTMTLKASENIAIVANLSTPTFLGNGTVAINADKNVDLMANYDITLGAAHDINATGTSNIRLTSPYIKLDRTGGGNLILDTNVDLNCANGHFLTLGNSGGGSYFQIQSGGAQVLTAPAGQSITLQAPEIDAIATNVNVTGAVNMVTGSLNMANHNITSVNNLQVTTINSAAYPPSSGSVVSSFTQLYTSTISGNPNYLTLTATRSITLNTSLSTIVKSPASYFSGDVRVSSLNGAAVGGGGGGGSWVGTATSALNMGTYPINGSALTINSSNSGDFTIKNQTGSGASLNLTGDTYMFFHTNTQDMYFDPHTDIGGNAPGSFNFGGNNFYASSYLGMNLTNYGTAGHGLTLTSYDRLLMYSDTQLSMTCSNNTVDFTGNGGVSITDSSTGGTGLLTVSATNHLYWNGHLIA